VDLRLVSAAGSDDRLLDQRRGIFADLDPGPGGGHQDHAACLAELERGLGVLVDEHFLDRGGIGRVVGQKRFKLGREMGEALGKRFGRGGFQLAVGDMGKTIALGPDQAPAGGAEARIEAEDQAQPSFSSSSSLIS